MLAGGRFDYVHLSQNGVRSIDPLFIFSPRLNLRYNPVKDWSLRLSYSEGFRAPQFFDEEMHVELAGGTPVARVLSDNLKEERSRSISVSSDWYKALGSWQLNVMLEGFYTSIRNQFMASPIETELDGIKQRTIINNIDGVARVAGATLEAKLAYKRLFDVQAGLTLQSSKYGSDKWPIDEDSETGQLEVSTRKYERTPDFYGYMTSTIRPTKAFSINLSATYTGSMLVPHEAYEGVPDGVVVDVRGHFDTVVDGQRMRGVAPGKAYIYKSSPFVDFDAKLGYDFTLSHDIKLSLNLGVQNIFGAYQRDTDMGPGRASTYIYGPTQPRRYFVSATLSI